MARFKTWYVFRAFWMLWRFAVYATALALHDLPSYALIIIWGTFLPVEVWAIFRKGKGDTLSESHWFFGQRGWAFRVWGGAHAVLYAYLAAITPEYALGLQHSVAWDIWCWGLGAWLFLHFLLVGKEG